MTTSLVSCSNPTPRRRHVVGDDEVEALASAASTGRWRSTSSVSAAKPTRVWPGRFAPERGEDVGGRLEDDSGDTGVLLELPSAAALGRKSATAAAITTTSARRRASRARRRSISAAVSTSTTSTPGGRRTVDGGDEGDLGAPGGGLGGEGVTLLARRAVADEAHGVDRLAGAAGGDEHPQTGEVVRCRATARRRPRCRLGLGQPARADVAAGEAARRGLDHVDAAAPEGGQVVLHRGVLPHLGVHGRADQDRRPGGEQRGGEQVVGDAGGVGAEHPGRGRGDDDQVGRLAEAGVRDRVGVVPQRRVHRLGGQRRERRAADEADRPRR